MIVAPIGESLVWTNWTASAVVICSKITFKEGKRRVMGSRYCSIKIFSRSKISTLLSVTSPWIASRRPVFCISSNIEGLEDDSPLLEQRASLIAVEGHLGNLKITLEPDQILNGGSQKCFDLKADQLIVLTKTHPPGIKRRTGVHLLSGVGNEILEETVRQVRELVGHFHKPVHLTYDQDICAGGDKGMETCGHCISYCPYDAISRQTENRLRIQVDHLSCEGCGACVSACHPCALQFLDPSPQVLYARMAVLLESSKHKRGNEEPLVIVFHCEAVGRNVLQSPGVI